MRKLDVSLPQAYNLNKVEKLIEHLCAELGLANKMKRGLREYQGSIHWHYKREPEKGTLEITLLPSESKISFSVHDNRRGPWIHDLQDELARETMRKLHSVKTKQSRT